MFVGGWQLSLGELHPNVGPSMIIPEKWNAAVEKDLICGGRTGKESGLSNDLYNGAETVAKATAHSLASAIPVLGKLQAQTQCETECNAHTWCNAYDVGIYSTVASSMRGLKQPRSCAAVRAAWKPERQITGNQHVYWNQCHTVDAAEFKGPLDHPGRDPTAWYYIREAVKGRKIQEFYKRVDDLPADPVLGSLAESEAAGILPACYCTAAIVSDSGFTDMPTYIVAEKWNTAVEKDLICGGRTGMETGVVNDIANGATTATKAVAHAATAALPGIGKMHASAMCRDACKSHGWCMGYDVGLVSTMASVFRDLKQPRSCEAVRAAWKPPDVSFVPNPIHKSLHDPYTTVYWNQCTDGRGNVVLDPSLFRGPEQWPERLLQEKKEENPYSW